MSRTAFILSVAFFLAYAQPTYRIRQTGDVPSGLTGIGDLVSGDTDHDSLPDYSFWRHLDTGTTYLWQIWEYRPVNWYVLVQSETCTGHPYVGPGMHKGLFIPADIGDGDADGLSEILGVNTLVFGDTAHGGHIDSIWQYLCIYESPASDSHPDSLVWSHMYSREYFSYRAWFPGDLDRDGRKEILFDDGEGWTRIFENSGDNQYELVFSTPVNHAGWDYAFGDFDQDSAQEFVFMPVSSYYFYVYECTGDDQYVLVDSVHAPCANGADVFSGHDLDGDGKPEFYFVYMRVVPGGDNEIVPRLVEIGNGPHVTLDDVSCGVNRRVRCGSLDDRQQCTDMSVTIHTSEALLGM